MKKNIALLIGLVFLLCGCTAEVNIEIKDDKVSESVVINAYPVGDYTLERLPGAFLQNVPASANDILAEDEGDVRRKGISYYTRAQESIVGGYRFTYSYDFKLADYKDARTVKNGFKSSNVYVDNVSKTILFSTDNGGLRYFSDEYPSLSTVKVNIKTDYKVQENNADYVNGNVYTWEFTKDNNNKGIYLLIDKTTINDNTEEDDNKDNENDNKGNSSNPIGNKTEDHVSDSSVEKEESKIVEEMNKHPFVFVIIGLIIFAIIVFMLSKVTKVTKVR